MDTGKTTSSKGQYTYVIKAVMHVTHYLSGFVHFNSFLRIIRGTNRLSKQVYSKGIFEDMKGASGVTGITGTLPIN